MDHESVSVVPGSKPRLRVVSRTGRIEIVAEPRDDLLIRGNAFSVSKGEGGEVTLTGGHRGTQAILARVPNGTDLVAGTGSASIRIRGAMGAVRATSEHGAIEIEQAASVDARSVTGRVTIGHSGGPCRVQTRSGQAEIRQGDDQVEVASESGKVLVRKAGGDVRVRTSHGGVEVTSVAPGDVAVQTISGKVKVMVPATVRPRAYLRTASGSLSCKCEEGDDCRVAVETLSGSVEVVPA
jgi:DUF4097 and DUF4098 domain-containing protein YvlB